MCLWCLIYWPLNCWINEKNCKQISADLTWNELTWACNRDCTQTKRNLYSCETLQQVYMIPTFGQYLSVFTANNKRAKGMLIFKWAMFVKIFKKNNNENNWK